MIFQLRNQVTFINKEIQVVLSYTSYFYNDIKVKDCLNDTLKNSEPYNDEELHQMILFFKEKKTSESTEIFKSFDNVLKFIGFLGLYLENNVNSENDKISIKEACMFSEVLTKEIGPLINSEGGTLAKVKIIKSFLSKGEEFKTYLLTKINKFDEVIVKSAMINFKPSNYPFILSFLNEFDGMQDKLGKTTNQGKYTESYLMFLENVYLRSFDILDHYNTLLNTPGEVIEKEFEELIQKVKGYINQYLNSEASNSIVQSSLKKLANQVIMFNIVLNTIEK